MIKINISNIKKVTAALEKYEKEAQETVAGVVKIKAEEIANDAKVLTRKDKGAGGGIASGIVAEQQETPLHYKVTSYVPYSPYHEFGTGGLVDIKEDWGEMAAQFKGKGIKQVNISPQPFMYPAYVKARATFNKELKEELKVLNKKFNNG